MQAKNSDYWWVGALQHDGSGKAFKNSEVDTPFGKPSDTLRAGKLDGQPLVFLPRHGAGHRLLPSEINFRANIYALKSLGVEQIISVSAVGSEKEEIAPRHFVVPDQIYDRTCKRANTFFGEGIAAHVSLDYPFCFTLSSRLYEVGTTLATVHKGGTYICMEGPRLLQQSGDNGISPPRF